MTIIDLRSRVWQRRMLGMLRMVAGLMFLMHGTQKLWGFPAPDQPMPAMDLSTMFGWSGILELVGGILIILGLGTRFVGFMLSGMMAVAYFTVHQKMGTWPIQNHGELAALYSFLFLYFAAAGGGAWSVDAVRTRRRSDDLPVTDTRTDQRRKNAA